MPLSNFGKSTTKNGPTSLAAPNADPPPAPPKDTRKQQTIRLFAAQWRRVKDFALDENATFQDLAVRGIHGSWNGEDFHTWKDDILSP